MGKFVMLLAAGLITVMSSTYVSAEQEADARIKACEQQNQDASDRYDAVMKCLDEEAQYDTSE